MGASSAWVLREEGNFSSPMMCCASAAAVSAAAGGGAAGGGGTRSRTLKGRQVCSPEGGSVTLQAAGSGGRGGRGT